MTSLSFKEHMAGFVTPGEHDYNEGLRRGRAEDTRCAFTLELDIADIDTFLDDPVKAATATGVVTCGTFGGTLPVERGDFNLFVPQAGAGRGQRMLYRLFVRDPDGRPLTFTGFKDVVDGLGLDIWSDTSTLFLRVLAGHVEAADEAGADVLAAGVLRISHAGFVKMMASMRPRGGPPWRRARALSRFQTAFVGTLVHVYGGRQEKGGQQDFPDPAHPAGDPFRGFAPEAWHAVPGHPGVERQILPLEAGDGLPLTLHHFRLAGAGGGSGAGDDGGDGAGAGSPVLCLHGTGVRGDIFVGAPGGSSTVRALLDGGHDVWVSNWRASIDLPPRPYTLDDGAVLDHPAAIAAVRERTGAAKVRVLAHCQGSTSFTITALSGLAGDVSHVVASAVSLHTVVPWRTRVKSRLMLPLVGLRMPYVSAQWGVRSPTALATGFARTARLVRRECDNPVCALGNYMYGTGPDVLWVHERLGEPVHDWVSREFGFAPYRFLRQMSRCTRAGHVVPVSGYDRVPDDLPATTPPAGQRWTFIAGTKNRLYRPVGQERSHAWWVEHGGGEAAGHALHLLDGYGHLDPLIGPGAPADVFPLILAGLAD